ncbi:MAG: hypothetical protein LBS85_00055 [Clostridiales Family XIII bacterium]|jgi:hypothetical protein|nr:hypothetical protein [Clostridiales Family XIII bacterium]
MFVYKNKKTGSVMTIGFEFANDEWAPIKGKDKNKGKDKDKGKEPETGTPPPASGESSEE